MNTTATSLTGTTSKISSTATTKQTSDHNKTGKSGQKSLFPCYFFQKKKEQNSTIAKPEEMRYNEYDTMKERFDNELQCT